MRASYRVHQASRGVTKEGIKARGMTVYKGRERHTCMIVSKARTAQNGCRFAALAEESDGHVATEASRDRQLARHGIRAGIRYNCCPRGKRLARRARAGSLGKDGCRQLEVEREGADWRATPIGADGRASHVALFGR